MANKDKRAERPIEEILASGEFVRAMVPRADAHDGPYPLWHGWALTDAFFAGIEYARRQSQEPSDAS